MQIDALHIRRAIDYLSVIRSRPVETGTARDQPGKTRKEKTMNLRKSYREWRQYRNTVAELNRMSDRDLTDLGITRGDIPFVVRNGK